MDEQRWSGVPDSHGAQVVSAAAEKESVVGDKGMQNYRMTVTAKTSMLICIHFGEDATSSFGMKRYRTAPRDSLQIPLQPLNKMSEGHRHRL